MALLLGSTGIWRVHEFGSGWCWRSQCQEKHKKDFRWLTRYSFFFLSFYYVLALNCFLYFDQEGFSSKETTLRWWWIREYNWCLSSSLLMGFCFSFFGGQLIVNAFLSHSRGKWCFCSACDHMEVDVFRFCSSLLIQLGYRICP